LKTFARGSHVIKADSLTSTVDSFFENAGVMDVFGSRTRIVSQNELVEIGKQLIAMHRPITIDYAAKFGINKNVVYNNQPQSWRFKKQ